MDLLNSVFRMIVIVTSAIGIANALFFAVFMVVRRTRSPIKQRPLVILIPFTVGIVGMLTYFLIFSLFDGSHCMIEIWLKAIAQNTYVLAVILACIRLYFGFKAVKFAFAEMKRMQESKESVIESRRLHWFFRAGNAVIKDRRVLATVALIGFVFIAVLSAISSAIIMNECNDTIVLSFSIVALVIGVGILVPFPFLLWKSHDHFYMKFELKMILFLIPIPVAGLALSNFDSTKYVGYFMRNIYFVLVQIGVYLIPTVKSFDVKRYQMIANSIEATDSDSGGGGESSEPVFDTKPFGKKTRITEFYEKGPMTLQYFEDYAAHYQKLSIPSFLAFVSEVVTYNLFDKGDEFRIGSAIVIIQRYLIPGAYMYICTEFDDEIQLDIETSYEELNNEDTEAERSHQIIDNVLKSVWRPIIDGLTTEFNAFFETDFYKQCEKVEKLNLSVK